MQYDVSTAEEYLQALAKDWRLDTLLSLRELIKTNAPELQERIKSKMLNYEDDRGPLFALNAQKGYVSLYVGNAQKVDPTGEFLRGLDHGKGCIRFRKSVKVAETRIDTFISRAVAVPRQGGDTNC